jgi:RNA polymerase sigma-70 factor (ECF subfamily)
LPESLSTSSEEERDLVRRVLESAPGAADEFVLRYRKRIHAVSLAILGFRDPEAEDAVQETFLAALAGLKNFEFRSSLYTWLNQICVRFCYKRIRERARTALGTQADLAELLGREAGAGQEAQAEGLRDERLAWLREALASMEGACRKLLSMRDLEGSSYGAISRSLKVPIGTVMSRLSRCREKLKKVALRRFGAGHG